MKKKVIHDEVLIDWYAMEKGNGCVTKDIYIKVSQGPENSG